MKQEAFEKVFIELIKDMENVLIAKARDYVMGEDRLHNFKRAAALEQTTAHQALLGMLSKHIISIYDYADRHENGEYFTLTQWQEKIHDYLNYGVLLYALIVEEEINRTEKICQTLDPTKPKT